MAGACFFVVLLCLIEIKAGCIIKKELLINCVLNLMFYFNKKIVTFTEWRFGFSLTL